MAGVAAGLGGASGLLWIRAGRAERTMTDEAIVLANAESRGITPGFDESLLCVIIDTWAEATSDPASPRFRDLRRDKARVVLDFFTTTRRPPALVTPVDVQTWQHALRRRLLAEATIYAQVSLLSSFYR